MVNGAGAKQGPAFFMMPGGGDNEQLMKIISMEAAENLPEFLIFMRLSVLLIFHHLI